MTDPVPTHPEEMTAHMEARIGNIGTIQATARATPAGLIACALLVGAVLLSTAVLARALRRG